MLLLLLLPSTRAGLSNYETGERLMEPSLDLHRRAASLLQLSPQQQRRIVDGFAAFKQMMAHVLQQRRHQQQLAADAAAAVAAAAKQQPQQQDTPHHSAAVEMMVAQPEAYDQLRQRQLECAAELQKLLRKDFQ